MNRSVTLLINGYMGPIRTCKDFGLPQGSAFSPVLFKFYISDLEMKFDDHDQIQFFKFADDGTAKVTGLTLEECLFYMAIVLEGINEWTCKWRMVVNCQPNKTELICFYSEAHAQVPKNFMLGSKEIKVVESSKVLGVILDRHLSFMDHSKAVYNKLVYKWISLCQYTNRNWGMNQAVLVRLIRTIFFSTLFYAGSVWMNIVNTKEINGLWYKISKSAVGAVFNVHQSILEVILGIPPLLVTNRINTTKHYLKMISQQPSDFKDPQLIFI